MTPFTCLRGIAAALPVANIDTDKIVPARFLKTVSRRGLGAALFRDWRFDADGEERSDFVLNSEPWRSACILVAGENFGCGSSREHAPWALADFGIRCVIAPTIADIFGSNCVKNGILPIAIDTATVSKLLVIAGDPRRAFFEVDLKREVLRADGFKIDILVRESDRNALLSGQDDIARSLAFTDAIAGFERSIGYPIPGTLC